jgi:SAM-dependent methyltransferase
MTEKLKNQAEWKPTKIKRRRGRFRVNPFKIGPGSYYITLEAFRVLNTCRPYLKGRLIDLGCGNTPYFEWYRDRVDTITCVDWPGSLHKSKHISVSADLNKPLPLADSSADCILSTSVLEHIREPMLLFSEMSRILKTGGHLILSVPFLYQIHEEPDDFFRYTRFGLEKLSKDAGFEIVFLSHYGSALGVMVDVISKIIHAVVMGFRRLLPKIISSPIKLVVVACLRLFQYICFIILKQKPAVLLLGRLNLSQKIPLGYVGVFKKTEKQNYK